MREGRGTVVLEKEVTCPCEAVASERHAEQPQRLTGDCRHEQRRDHQHRADEVQPAAHRMTMLRQVEGIEVREAAEAALRGGRRGGIHDGPVVFERGPSFLSPLKGVKQEADGNCYVCITSMVTGLR